MSDNEKLPVMTPDMDLAEQLRKDFTAKTCVEALMNAAADMAKAIGVKVSWEVIDVLDIDVDKNDMSKALGRLATAGGAMLMGSKINPISMLAIQKYQEIDHVEE